MGYYGGYGYGGGSYFTTDILLFLGMLILPMLAELGVKGTFSKYSRVHSRRGITADEVARRILASNGIDYVSVGHVGGHLSDHYSPVEKAVNLSDSVYGHSSLSAIGVAAHECGHVCQHHEGYVPIQIRSAIVPVTDFCSRLWYLVFIAGCFFTAIPVLIYVGIAMYAFVVLFQLVTLPVELNASRRALKTLKEDGILEPDEIAPARRVLTAAAMTYVAGLAASAMQLMRLLLRVRRRDDDD